MLPVHGAHQKGGSAKAKGTESSPRVSLCPDGVWWGWSEAGQARWNRQDSTQREAPGTREWGVTVLPLLLLPRLGSPLGLEPGSCSVMFCSE